MDLPERAKAMYKNWWSFVSYAASAVSKVTQQFLYTLTDATAAASDIAKSIGGVFARWDPIGLSQLFAAARRLAGIGQVIGDAGDEVVTSTLNIPEAPWSRSQAEQSASPSWQARTSATYINEIGEQVSEYFTLGIDQVLPPTVGELKAQVNTAVDQMLTGQAENGTPRRGQLVSVDSVALMAV
jgi:hypothetical protein